MTYQRGCESMVPPVARGEKCTRCGKHPQAAIHKRLALTLPREQFSWCGNCRGNVKLKANTIAKAAPKADGQTHCACGAKLCASFARRSNCRRKKLLT